LCLKPIFLIRDLVKKVDVEVEFLLGHALVPCLLLRDLLLLLPHDCFPLEPPILTLVPLLLDIFLGLFVPLPHEIVVDGMEVLLSELLGIELHLEALPKVIFLGLLLLASPLFVFLVVDLPQLFRLDDGVLDQSTLLIRLLNHIFLHFLHENIDLIRPGLQIVPIFFLFLIYHNNIVLLELDISESLLLF
jgi:hypothetical protein